MTEVLLKASCREDHEWDFYGVALPVQELPPGQWLALPAIDAVARAEDLRCPTYQPAATAVAVAEPESLA